MNDFLKVKDLNFLVVGVANKKSVAYEIGRVLTEAGARVFYSVLSEDHRKSVAKLLPGAPIFVCNVEKQEEIARLYEEVKAQCPVLHGLVHSIAFANYSQGIKPFHETPKPDFLQAFDISCYSLINLSNQFKDLFHRQASVVTISIMTTVFAVENYGYMAPIKAALNSSLVFLAKSFSRFSEVRFNAVGAGPLKTSAAAGIPGFVDSYLFAELRTLRKRNLATREVANAAVFLLSEASSGITGQVIVIDAGSTLNGFDAEIIRRSTRIEQAKG